MHSAIKIRSIMVTSGLRTRRFVCVFSESPIALFLLALSLSAANGAPAAPEAEDVKQKLSMVQAIVNGETGLTWINTALPTGRGYGHRRLLQSVVPHRCPLCTDTQHSCAFEQNSVLCVCRDALIVPLIGGCVAETTAYQTCSGQCGMASTGGVLTKNGRTQCFIVPPGSSGNFVDIASSDQVIDAPVDDNCGQLTGSGSPFCICAPVRVALSAPPPPPASDTQPVPGPSEDSETGSDVRQRESGFGSVGDVDNLSPMPSNGGR